MHERTNVNCLLHESSTHRRPWSSCHQDRSLLGLEIFNRPSAFATWGVWWSRGFLVLFYGSACTWYKQSERFTSTRDQLCLQSFSVSDSESAWHLIESSPISEISSLGSNPWSSRGPGFYAVVCFLPFILKGLQKITPSFLKGMWRTGPQNKGNSPSILFPACTQLHRNNNLPG